MHSIDTAGSVLGAFQDGDAETGVRGTRVGAAWLNDVQDNLLAVLAEAGVAPTKGRADDLLDAIMVVVAGAVGDGAGAVPTTRQVIAAGLATGGGSLAADRTITVAKASDAEVVAGTEDGKAITPLALATALGAGLDTGTFQFGPLIITWGDYIAYLGESTVVVPFPTAFPTECFGVSALVYNNTAAANRDVWVQLVGAPGPDGFTARIQGAGGSSDSHVDGIHFIAIGR